MNMYALVESMLDKFYDMSKDLSDDIKKILEDDIRKDIEDIKTKIEYWEKVKKRRVLDPSFIFDFKNWRISYSMKIFEGV